MTHEERRKLIETPFTINTHGHTGHAAGCDHDEDDFLPDAHSEWQERTAQQLQDDIDFFAKHGGVR